MNRFRSRKKSHDGGDSQRPSLNLDLPPLPPTSSSKGLKWGKGSRPEAKQPEVDIGTVLPSSENFRTSLLMPNLSARFSMLREQDDPKTKIGKANDDSVLFPKRTSRLNLFGHDEFADAVEVSSAPSSARPPFAYERNFSHGSSEGYGTDDGGIMNRSRAGEGNTLFGGRQKIYKIPMNSSDSSKNPHGSDGKGTAPSKGMGGRLLYGDDVASSAFRRLREQEVTPLEPHGTQSPKEQERSESPSPTNYLQRRETASSTTSGPSQSRISTAATSVVSQRSMNGTYGSTTESVCPLPNAAQGTNMSANIDRQPTKSRRLYGQGLDQHIHDQQSSAIGRLESLHRQRAIGLPPLSKPLTQSRSAHNTQEGFHQPDPVYASNGFQSASPPPGTPERLASFDLGLSDEHSASTSKPTDSGYGQSPSLNPSVSPSPDPALASALEPSDVGKATGFGALNLPRKQYDEQQYSQRQIQLQHDREIPPLSRPFSPLASSRNGPSVGITPAGHPGRRGPLEHVPHQSINEHALAIVPEHHDSANAISDVIDQYDPQMQGTFLAAISPSDTGLPQGNDLGRGSNLVGYHPSPYNASSVELKHAKSTRRTEHDSTPDSEYNSKFLKDQIGKAGLSNSNETVNTYTPEMPDEDPSGRKVPDADSPTLGPTTQLSGLNGLVRAHLRSDSGQSSIYPEQSPALMGKFLQHNTDDYTLGNGHDIRQSDAFFQKGAWRDDCGDSRSRGPIGLGFTEDIHGMPLPLSIKARNVDQANALRSHESAKAQQILGNDKAQKILGHDAPRSHASPQRSSWQEQLGAHHARGGSNETEKERQIFADELAERRRIVQNNLKSFVENETRSPSPLPGNHPQDHGPSKPGAPFGFLKTASGKSSTAPKQENPSKALKMLGVSNPSNLTNEGSRPVQDLASNHYSEEKFHSTNYDRRYLSQGRSILNGSQRPNHFPSQTRQEQVMNKSQESLPQRRSPPSSLSSRNGRPNSESPDRQLDVRIDRGRSGFSKGKPRGDSSQSRNRDVYPSPKLPGVVGAATEFFENAANRQHSAERSKPAVTGRDRSRSRSNPASYFESRSQPPLWSSPPQHQKILPRTPYSTDSQHSTPPLPGIPPALPASTVPVMMHSPPSHPPTRPSYRKKSINKQDISDPMFISSTSSVTTVNLPAGASLSNGMTYQSPGAPSNHHPPSHRKRNQNIFHAWGKSDKAETSTRTPSPVDDPVEERSTFSADESEPKPKIRQRLRKSSSDGGSLSAKARQQALNAPSPPMPSLPPNVPGAPSPALSHYSPSVSPMMSSGYRFQHQMPTAAPMF